KSQIKAKKIATQYVASFDGIHSLLFSGNCGLGKSHLSFSITKALRQKGYKTLYIKVTDLFDYIKNAYKPDSKINEDRKSTRLNSSHVSISYAVFCLKKKSTRCKSCV